MQFSRVFALAFAATACVAASAAEPGVEWIPYHSQDPKRWSRPSLVVRPTYPPEAVARRLSGSVEIEGVVQGTGYLKDILFTPDSPASAVFVEALEKVTPYWRFNPAIGNDCQPTAEVVVTKVSFELDGNEPRVFVIPSQAHAGEAWQLPDDMNPVHMESPAFPESMLRLKWEARVYARQEVDPYGKVMEVKGSVHSRQGGPLARGDIREFERAAERSLLAWKYPPAPNVSKLPRFICQEIEFKLPQ
jgi:hypothetical protein